MTVKEMIAELSKCNPDAHVTVNIDGGINVGKVTRVIAWDNVFEIFFDNWMLKENEPLQEAPSDTKRSKTQIVIEISEETYKATCNGSMLPPDVENVVNAIKNGVPLPKGHKRLIEDNFEVGPVFDEEGNRVGYKYVTQEDLNNAHTIIEADDTESEERR